MSVLPLDQIRELLESGHTDSEIAAKLGVHRKSVQRFRAKYGLAASHRVGETDRWRTPRDLTAPKEDGTTRLYPIHPGKPALRIDLESLKRDLLDEVRQIVKGWKTLKVRTPPAKCDLLSVHAPVDLHVGSLAWAPETGEDYDISIARTRLHDATERLLERSGRFPVASQLLVVGNDLGNIDNLLQTTTAGTLQDTDSRYRKMFREAVKMMADTIRRMIAVAPVKVIVVPGNHDSLFSFHVGELLKAMFADIRGITIDDSLRARLYHEHGKTLLGFTHGNEERHADLPLVMAQECPSAWGRTTYREFLVGHLHKRRQTAYVAGDSFNGVKVTILPSLTGTNSWHARKGYIGEPKASESMLYDATEGCIARFTATMSV